MRGSGIPAGLAACVIAALVAGCGTAPTSSQGAASSSSQGGASSSSQGAAPSPSQSATGATPAGAGTPTGCARSGAVGPRTFTVTVASTGKTYCLHVGDKLRVYLRGTDSSKWLRPVASSSSLEPAPDPAGMLARGVTGGSFAAVRPGRVLVTSVRPPCRAAIPNHELEPADPLPRIYPIQRCAPSHRFSVWITVQRTT
jgi:hypothetical protein